LRLTSGAHGGTQSEASEAGDGSGGGGSAQEVPLLHKRAVLALLSDAEGVWAAKALKLKGLRPLLQRQEFNLAFLQNPVSDSSIPSHRFVFA
jgi:hypothetical protein